MNKKANIKRILEIPLCILPTAFWILIVFSFEEPIYAIATLTSALIHEIGHLTYLVILQGKNVSLKAALNGFRIGRSQLTSYNEDILTYLSGPLSNIFAFILCVLLSLHFHSSLMILGVINCATAISNLLPIKGYDGYGTIKTLMKKHELSDKAFMILDGISTMLIFVFCLFSLYLINRYGEGYWIFAVFLLSAIDDIKEKLHTLFSRFNEF